MEAGDFDRSPRPRKTRRWFLSFSGLSLIGLGLIFLAGGGAYFGYSWWAHSNLDSLNVTAADMPDGDAPGVLQSNRESSGTEDLTAGQITTLRLSPEAIAAQALFPGEALNPVFWSDPLAGESTAVVLNPLLDEFDPIDLSSVASWKSLPAPTRITIPAIGVDSDVNGLQILDLGDSRAYETPKNIVGHIPETANAGENGTAWFFGHLESPIAGEGNVFAKLPQIPNLLRQGPVYTTVDNGETTFLYRLTASEVIHEDDLTIYELGGPSISLVACVPRFEYDYRLVVTGELVGVKG
ncbi:MAG: sortase [Dehalococcoidia bacterium]|nr:sortase [Chloroflexota bacterium]